MKKVVFLMVTLGLSGCARIFLSDTVLEYSLSRAIDKEFDLNSKQQEQLDQRVPAIVQMAKKNYGPALIDVFSGAAEQLPLDSNMSDEEFLTRQKDLSLKLLNWLEQVKVQLKPEFEFLFSLLEQRNWEHFSEKFNERKK